MPLADPELPVGLTAPDLPSRAPAGVSAGRYARFRDGYSRLPRRLRLVIAWRFGLAGCERLTLAETGRRLDVTRERVRQLVNAAENELLVARDEEAARGHPDARDALHLLLSRLG